MLRGSSGEAREAHSGCIVLSVMSMKQTCPTVQGWAHNLPMVNGIEAFEGEGKGCEMIGEMNAEKQLK